MFGVVFVLFFSVQACSDLVCNIYFIETSPACRYIFLGLGHKTLLACNTSFVYLICHLVIALQQMSCFLLIITHFWVGLAFTDLAGVHTNRQLEMATFL